MTQKTLGDYLLDQLFQRGVEHIFGIPGDYILRFDKLIEKHPSIQFINTTRENTAGYMADAYGRFKGLGVACITYGVGINIVNALAQAYVESSPLVVISGAPSSAELSKEVRLHHLFNKSLQEHIESTQFEIFEHITVAQALLNNSKDAAKEIDRVLTACLTLKKPVYLEIPRDQVDQEVALYESPLFIPEANALALQEGLSEIRHILLQSRRPVFWIGHEILRFGLTPQILEFARTHSIPIISSLLGKTAISEHDPLFLGVYLGGMSPAALQEYVNSCDCMLRFGVLLNDLDTGIFTAKFPQKNQIIATSLEFKINQHCYPKVAFSDLVSGLNLLDLQKEFPSDYRSIHKPLEIPFNPEPSNKISVDRLFACIQSHLQPEHVLISDIGDCLFGSAELELEFNSYLACAHFASLSFSIPAALGVQLACPTRRPFVIVGDGAFQMTAMELSTAVRYDLDPIIVLMNNHGYGTERPILEGGFNDILNWNYTEIPRVLGKGRGIKVTTEADLDKALAEAVRTRGEFSLIEVDLAKHDLSVVLQRFGSLMNQQAGEKKT